MRVLGVDPGMTRCGVGLVEGSNRQVKLIQAGVIRTPADLDSALRLLRIWEELDELITTFRPETVAIERVFTQHNLHSVTGTSQVAGIAMVVAAKHGIKVRHYTPSEVKAAITGSGSADKAQVGTMVAKILRLKEPPKPADAADAIAIAICNLWRGETANRVVKTAEYATQPVTNRYAQAVAAHQKKTRRQSQMATNQTTPNLMTAKQTRGNG